MQQVNSILIVDDEPDIRELLEITIGRMGIETRSAANLKDARELLSSRRFSLCLTDMNLPDGNGMELIALIQEQYADMPVAMITAYGNMDTAIAALKAGAFDFVSKPIELERLRVLINSALKLNTGSKTEISYDSDIQLLGDTAVIRELRHQITKLARSQAPVYINGESGSGKELVARLIHKNSPRANAPFVPVNCGAIPSELMESEFFGHVKGSFTGATEDKIGLFRAAEGGTLFLDEVADLPLAMQVKLLRAIQEKAVRPVGGNSECPIDVRILSATHKDLAQEVKEERFRNDLFYRINVIDLPVPSLRDRREDIPLLVDRLLMRMTDGQNRERPRISDAALQALYHYHFPGNVRELENILERAITLCENNLIEPQDLQLPEPESGTGEKAAPTTDSPVPASQTIADKRHNSDEGFGNLDGYLEDVEKEIISRALEKERWNKTAAAKLLGISFRALRYKLKKYNLE